jgi:hypothetical protein
MLCFDCHHFTSRTVRLNSGNRLEPTEVPRCAEAWRSRGIPHPGRSRAVAVSSIRSSFIIRWARRSRLELPMASGAGIKVIPAKKSVIPAMPGADEEVVSRSSPTPRSPPPCSMRCTICCPPPAATGAIITTGVPGSQRRLPYVVQPVQRTSRPRTASGSKPITPSMTAPVRISFAYRTSPCRSTTPPSAVSTRRSRGYARGPACCSRRVSHTRPRGADPALPVRRAAVRPLP